MRGNFICCYAVAGDTYKLQSRTSEKLGYRVFHFKDCAKKTSNVSHRFALQVISGTQHIPAFVRLCAGCVGRKCWELFKLTVTLKVASALRRELWHTSETTGKRGKLIRSVERDFCWFLASLGVAACKLTKRLSSLATNVRK